jgi:hypothetical protein
MANDYHAAGDQKEAILGVMLTLLVTLRMVVVRGRVIRWLFQRLALPSGE